MTDNKYIQDVIQSWADSNDEKRDTVFVSARIDVANVNSEFGDFRFHIGSPWPGWSVLAEMVDLRAEDDPGDNGYLLRVSEFDLATGKQLASAIFRGLCRDQIVRVEDCIEAGCEVLR